MNVSIWQKGESMDERKMIYLDDAIDAICKHGTALERRGITMLSVANHKQVMVDLLESLPPAQPEIVRCCECDHILWCDEQAICHRFNMTVEPDFFCADGERSER